MVFLVITEVHVEITKISHLQSIQPDRGRDVKKGREVLTRAEYSIAPVDCGLVVLGQLLEVLLRVLELQTEKWP